MNDIPDKELRHTIAVNFDRAKLVRLKKAIKGREITDTIDFEGQQLVVGYAQYLVEYLERRLPK